MLTLFSGYLNQFVESNYGMLPGSGYCFLEKEAWDARAIPDVKRRILMKKRIQAVGEGLNNARTEQGKACTRKGLTNEREQQEGT